MITGSSSSGTCSASGSGSGGTIDLNLSVINSAPQGDFTDDTTTTWTTHNVWGGSEEQLTYTDEIQDWTPAAITQNLGGGVTITASDNNGNITSGELNSADESNGEPIAGGFSFTYGYFAITVANGGLPSDPGTWAAFWSMPLDSSACEIDVDEAVFNDPSKGDGSLHAGAGYSTNEVSVPNYNANGPNTYGVDWEPDFITWYYNGVQVGQAATPSSCSSPHYLIANLAIGGSSSWPASYAAYAGETVQMNIQSITYNPGGFNGGGSGTYSGALASAGNSSSGTSSCTGSSSGSSSSGGTIVNGQCGSADGQTFTSAPTTGLCNSGTPSTVQPDGNFAWIWTCAGTTNGGTTQGCDALVSGAASSSSSSSSSGVTTGSSSSGVVSTSSSSGSGSVGGGAINNPGGGSASNPARAADFLNIISLQGCTSGGSPYCQDTTQFPADVAYLGARHYRDGLNISNLDVLQALVNEGVSLIGGIPDPGTYDTTSLLNSLHSWQNLGSNALVAAEGVNEPDGFGPVTYNGQPCGSQGNADSWTPCAYIQRDYYAAIKGDSTLNNIAVFGETRVGNQWPDTGIQFTVVQGGHSVLPDGTNVQTHLNNHVYPMWQNQYWNGTSNEASACQTNDPAASYYNQGGAFAIQMYYDNVHGFGGASAVGYPDLATAAQQPHVVTEFGYATLPAAGPNTGTIDEDKKGRCILTGLMNGYKFGESLISIYSIYDGDDGFGLMSSPGVTKAPAVDLHNFTSILSDTGIDAQTFGVAPLSYTISNAPAHMNTFVLQKSNGHWELVVWDDSTNWDSAAGAPIAVGPTNVTLNVSGGNFTLTLYDPLVDITAQQSASNSMTFGITDGPTIIDIAGSSAGTPQ